MATVGPTAVMVVNSPPAVQSPKLRTYKNIVFGLGVAETVLGFLSMILGSVQSSSITGYRFYGIPYSYAEGIWSGIWVLTAGILGIAASKKERLTSCLINCHMGIAITASVFAAFQIGLSSVSAVIFSRSGLLYFNIAVVLCIVGFLSFVICIASASLCCPLHTTAMGTSSCCGACCCDERPAGRQVTVQYTQPETIIQSSGGIPIVSTYGHTSIPGIAQPQAYMVQSQSGQAQGMITYNPQMPIHQPSQLVPIVQQMQAESANPEVSIQKEAQVFADAQ
uniref:Uncharacterized LOC100176440 n=1 Tax=Ciona intestinalis TaxID=7719 RepID=F6QA93_CIOIN|nr:uncharacterized protein LOC100176440 [Ciona intestinalis]|eukprot:XP_002129707.1 uncharacterized protein LOC100176440 [Ciona intestinalis]